jgi:VWFA-related protein
MPRSTRVAFPLLVGALLMLSGSARPSARGASQPPVPPATQPPPQTPPAGQDPAQQPPPVFRTGINFVRVDVIVTDGKGNPVTDLDENDFDVFEDGKKQQIESFKLYQIGPNPGPEAEPARPINNEYVQESEAARPDVRLFAILLDDYHVRLGSSMGVREPLIRFVSSLSPLDMVTVMYPLTPVSLLQFTRNKESLISAIEAFKGRKYDYEPKNEFEEKYAYYPAVTVEAIRNQISLSAIRSLVTWLGSLREGRKSVILVSEGYTYNLPAQLADPIAAMPGLGNPAHGRPGEQANDPYATSQRFFKTADMMTDLREVYDAANRANTSIYALDPRGLAAFNFDINEGVGTQTDRESLNETIDTLHVLADETDGRAIVNTNNLDAGLRQAVTDSSVYYLLGYNSSEAPTDGKFHEIKVKVKRPGLQVRARKGYWAYTAEDATRAADAPKKPGPAPDVEEALSAIVDPPRGRAARTWVGTERGEQGKTRVTFVWEPLPPQPGDRNPLPPPVKADLTVTSGDSTLVFRGPVSPDGPAPAPGVRQPAAVSFDAEPGPLEFRVSFVARDGGVVDSERRTLTAPDFTAPEVSLSTPRVMRAATPREMQALKENPDATPVSSREFSRRERLLLRFEAYGPGGSAPTVGVKLLNQQAQPMSDLTVQPPAVPGGAYETEVPLAGLPPGEYLIEVRATGTEGHSTRQLVGIKVTS